MSFDQNSGFTLGTPAPTRKLVDVTSMGLVCAECNAPIGELPFQPSPDRPVYCKDCNQKRRSNFGSR